MSGARTPAGLLGVAGLVITIGILGGPSPSSAQQDSAVLFRNVRIFDGKTATLSAPSNVLVRNKVIEKITTGDAAAPAEVIDGGGRVLMPGLIDAHWHAMLVRPTPMAAMAGDVGYNNLLAAAEATKFQRRMIAMAVKPGSDGPNALLDALVLGPVRYRIGLSRARLCLTTGAPARADVGAWFAAIRRPLTDAYGHAESGGVVTFAAHRGTARTIEGVTLETLGSGEIRLRSDTLFAGYAGETVNAAADGWWHSGDVVHAGQTHPAGRVVDLLGGGSGAACLRSEADLATSPYIADAFLHRDEKGRVIAAVLMDADSVVKFAQDNSIPFTHFLSLCRSQDIRALIGRVVAETNARVPVKIDDFTLIERALGPGDPEVSAMLVLRRRLLRPQNHSSRESAISESA